MDFSGNDNFRDEGAERHARVLGQRWLIYESVLTHLSHLDLNGNKIGDPIIFKIRGVVQSGASLSLSLYTYIHTHTYIRINMHTYTFVCMYACMYLVTFSHIVPNRRRKTPF